MEAPTAMPIVLPLLLLPVEPPSPPPPVDVEVGAADPVGEGICPLVAVPDPAAPVVRDEVLAVGTVVGRLVLVDAMLSDGAPTKVVSLTPMMVWAIPGVMVRALLDPSSPLQLHFPVLKSSAQQKRSSPQAANLPSALSGSFVQWERMLAFL